jgi:predicted enzyme related to lactoylglutathione lyase
LLRLGISGPEDDPTVRIQAPGQRPSVFFQRVPEPKAIKNRLHLDLRCESFEDELDRLTALGAGVLAEYDTFVVLSDPEGNEFCLSRRSDSE